MQAWAGAVHGCSTFTQGIAGRLGRVYAVVEEQLGEPPGGKCLLPGGGGEEREREREREREIVILLSWGSK